MKHDEGTQCLVDTVSLVASWKSLSRRVLRPLAVRKPHKLRPKGRGLKPNVEQVYKFHRVSMRIHIYALRTFTYAHKYYIFQSPPFVFSTSSPLLFRLPLLPTRSFSSLLTAVRRVQKKTTKTSARGEKATILAQYRHPMLLNTLPRIRGEFYATA